MVSIGRYVRYRLTVYTYSHCISPFIKNYTFLPIWQWLWLITPTGAHEYQCAQSMPSCAGAVPPRTYVPSVGGVRGVAIRADLTRLRVSYQGRRRRRDKAPLRPQGHYHGRDVRRGAEHDIFMWRVDAAAVGPGGGCRRDAVWRL